MSVAPTGVPDLGASLQAGRRLSNRCSPKLKYNKAGEPPLLRLLLPLLRLCGGEEVEATFCSSVSLMSAGWLSCRPAAWLLCGL